MWEGGVPRGPPQLKRLLQKKSTVTAMGRDRTQVNCLESSYVHHYTTIAMETTNLAAHSAIFITVSIWLGKEEESERIKELRRRSRV